MAFDKGFWQTILGLSYKWKPKFVRVFLDAVAASLEGLTAKTISEPMARGDLFGVEAALNRKQFLDHLDGYKPLFTRLLQESGQATADYISTGARAKFGFDLVDPNAVHWINNHSAELVRYIDDSSRTAIREIIRDGFENGITPKEMAKRIEQHIGLDPQRSRALQKHRESLIEGGFSPSEVSRRSDQFARRLLKDRAYGIALNETLEASNQGFFLGTKQAVARGILDPQKYEGYRIVTPDDRLCPRCSSIRGERRQLPDGCYRSTGRQVAKVHNCCRCCEGIRAISG